MQAIQVPTANGIHDIKLIGDNDEERLFIKQLAEAGTLSCVSNQVGDSILFRAISVQPEISSYTSTKGDISRYNFNVRQNQSENFDLTFKSGGVALPLVQFEQIKLQIKHSKSAPAIVELTVGTGLVISVIDNNVLSVSLTAAQTKLLTCESYYYDVLMVKPSSNKYYLEGKVTVKLTVTR